jgi:hypothetical protein
MQRALVLAMILAATPAASHEWYTSQKNAGGEGCCGGEDCAPVPVRAPVHRVGDGYDVTLQKTDLPSLAISRDPKLTALGWAVFHYSGNPGLSPDGFIHACIAGSDVVRRRIRCLFIGGAS